MAVDSGAELIKGITVRLLATAGVSALVGTKIYNRVPQPTDYPFIVVSANSESYAAKDFSKMAHKVRVQAFTRTASAKDCLDIRAAVIEALDRQEANITVTGFSLVKLELASLIGYFSEPDGITWQSFVEFDAVVN